MVFTLVKDIGDNHRQIFPPKRNNTIFTLPMKGVAWFDFVIYKMGAIPFDLAHKFRKAYFWRDADHQMNMIFNPTNCVNNCA